MRQEENDILTQVGPGTPMGNLFRLHWIPVLLSSELPERDGPPIQVRLLGEDLIAFRDTSGEVGLLERACPHRRASLYFGRNEDNGLRCIYHGWKFDVSGRCLDIPNDPSGSRLKDTVRATAYPCVERNGIIWTYMGPPSRQRRRATDEVSPPPPLPEFEWSLMPQEHSYFWKALRSCNWLQCLEGDLDSSHLGILHSRLDEALDEERYVTVPGVVRPGNSSEAVLRTMRRVRAPELDVAETDYGLMYTAKRPVDDHSEYHRISQFVLPFFTMVGARTDRIDYNVKAWIPMDDTHTLVLECQFRRDQVWTAEDRAQMMAVRNPHGFLPPSPEPGGAWRLRANRDNDYQRDLELQRNTLFCGIMANPIQDAAVQESMGPIVDRSREILCSADAAITRMRRVLVRSARRVMERDELPATALSPGVHACRPVAAVLPIGADWIEATAQQRQTRTP
jgi:phthalate 4,5-dioxygenase